MLARGAPRPTRWRAGEEPPCEDGSSSASGPSAPATAIHARQRRAKQRRVEAGLATGRRALCQRLFAQSEAVLSEAGHDRTAIDEGKRYAFETTLGANTIPFELMRSLAMGCRLDLFFVGLESVELHVQRVAERVRRGGHDIPEKKIRERYDNSRKNLLSFIGTAANLRVWDNSRQSTDGTPSAFEVFSIKNRRLELGNGRTLKTVPVWAKPLLARAFKMVDNDFSS